MDRKDLLEIAEFQGSNVYSKVKELLEEGSDVEAEGILIKSLLNEY